MHRRLAVVVLLLTVAPCCRAQEPQIADVWPPGGQRGSKVTARVEGGNLAGAKTVLISGHGVQARMDAPAKDGGSVPLTLDIASDAAPGPYEVRVVSPKGLSNPGYLWIGAYREIEEKEPNNQPAEAMKVDSLPVTINGRINGGEDVDWYQFHADAGDTYVVDICANRLYAPLDPFLELHDMAGHLLASATEGYDRDPRLIHRFEKAGEYLLQVRDTLYRGGGNFVYRLTVGKIPVITSLFPPGGRRGEMLNARVEGVNLGGMTTLSIALPAGMPEDRAYYILPDTPGGPALPVAVAGDDNAQISEPDALAAIAPLAIGNPGTTLNGTLRASKEVDAYRISAEGGKPLQVAVAARAIGSRMLPYLRVVDSAGKELMNTEDQIGRDPQTTFTPPANGVYRIEVSSIDARGGPDYPYRLILRPPVSPDFRLTASPDSLVLGHGQTLVVNISAERRGDFEGDIIVKPAELPAGVTASPLTLHSGQTSGIMTLTAATDAPLSNVALHIVGEAAALKSKDGKAAVRHEAEPIANLPRPGEGQVVPRPVLFQMATVTDAVPLYTLAVESTQITLTPGQTVMLKVHASRKPGDNGANPAIALTLDGLPPGVTAETPAIPEKQADITIKLVAAADAKPASQSALLTGKIGDNAQQPAPALLITIKAK